MEKVNFIEDDKFLHIIIPQKLFSKEAILNCFYWKLNELNIHFSMFSTREFQISIDLTSISHQKKDSLKNTLPNDLLDFELREIVNKETKNIKELILAKAFANGLLDDLE
jgi:His-Xaa-Ser system protein HxsD